MVIVCFTLFFPLYQFLKGMRQQMVSLSLYYCYCFCLIFLFWPILDFHKNNLKMVIAFFVAIPADGNKSKQQVLASICSTNQRRETSRVREWRGEG